MTTAREAAPALETPSATSRHQLVAFAVMVVFFVVAPFFIYPLFLMKALCFALFACAFNLLIGYVGLLSFGHAAFLGSAGYISAHTAKVWGWPPELAILAGTVVAGALGVLIGALAIRSRGIYFANITLALAQMIYFFCLQAPFTHGEDGIQAVPRGMLFGLLDLRHTMTMYFVVLAGRPVASSVRKADHPPCGREELRSVDREGRELIRGHDGDRGLEGDALIERWRIGEPRAVSLGYTAEQYKLLAFVLSGTLAGLAGGTKAIVFQLASLTDVHWTMSGEVVLMTLLGGLGTVFGPVVGAFIVVSLENYLSQLGSWVTVVQGVIFVLCVLTFRRGVIGELARLIKKPL